MTTWATVAEVASITGTTITDAQLAAAGAVIDIYSNRTVAASAAGAISPRDLNWLKQATAWQAVWQAGQPGYTTRHTVAEVNQDSVRVVYGAEHHVTLAPLAARALRNLSWKADRSLRVPNIRVPRGLEFDPTSETSDELFPWTLIGGGG